MAGGDVQVSASSTIAEGVPHEELEASSSGLVGHNDLLIVGPGVLGRLVAEKWREDIPVVPIGRSPRMDVILKVEKVVMVSGGCVIRLAGLYISFLEKKEEDF